MENLTYPLVDYAVASMTLAGESESGDQHLVQAFPGGVLVAVVDGLGHGREAAQAAATALETLKEHPEQSLVTLVSRCQEKLRHGRGVVMSLASFHSHDSTMSWIGVGNVNGVLVRADHGTGCADKALLLRAGVVGACLPPLQSSSLEVFRGDTLILATDGVGSGFYDEVRGSDPPQKMADHVLRTYVRGADDAMVLVARFLGEAP